MAGKKVKAKGGILDKITKPARKAGEGLATYLLEGLYLKKKGAKSVPGAKRVKAK